MAVAKTYEKLEICGEPFKEQKRMYVYVLTSKGKKKVRWYTDAEYRRMYPGAVIKHNVMDFNAKHVFGFEKTNYITIYRGDNVEEWANEDRTNIYFNLTFGFYTPGQLELPHVTNEVEPIRLMWDEVAADEIRMRPHAEVQKIIAKKLGTESKSKFQGKENEWLQKEVTIKENKTRTDRFSEKHIHTMVDNDGNVYLWETSTTSIARRKTIHLKMKVKSHKEINGEETTIVWYCKVI